MLNSNKIKLLIFDMDGTLANTAYLNFYSYYNAFKSFDIELDKNFYYKECFGFHYKIFINNILKLNDKLSNDIKINEELIEKIHNKKEEIYLNNLNFIKIHPLILDILNMNNENKNKKHTALATTASPNGVNAVLNEFNLKKFFDIILTGNDVINKKPHPEIFFRCMEHFNVLEKESIIFEDSDAGLEAADKTKAWIIKIEKWG